MESIEVSCNYTVAVYIYIKVYNIYLFFYISQFILNFELL